MSNKENKDTTPTESILDMSSHYMISNTSNIFDYTIDSNDLYISISKISAADIVYSVSHDDTYEKLEKYESEEAEDEQLRKRYPVLQEAYDEYLLIKKLVEDTPFDKTFEYRYAGFIKKWFQQY